MKARKLVLLLIVLSLPILSLAEGFKDVMETPWINDKVLMYSFYIVIVILLFIFAILYRVMNHMRNYASGEFDKEEVLEEKMNKFRGIERFLQLKPLSSDKDTVIEDHNYDGIQELDNPPPPWFMFLFYGTIVFAIVYMMGYVWTGSWPTQEEEYNAQIEQAEAAKEAMLAEQESSIDENTVVASTDEADITSGKGIYVSKCQVCHLEGGKGMTGPNLTDKYWVNGGSDADIFKVIKYGVLDKGMIAWQDQLTPKMMQDVLSYIRTLEYIGPEDGGKEPQGELYVEGTSTTDDSTEPEAATDSESSADEVTDVTEESSAVN